MSRLFSLRSKVDPVAAATCARWLVFAVCFAWLGAGVVGSARINDASTSAAAALVRLAVIGPPILCLLLSTALLNPRQKLGDEASVDFEGMTRFGRLRDAIAEIETRISAAIARADGVVAALSASSFAAERAIGETHDALTSLTEHLRRLDDLSKETTSAVAKRAYALDAALDGVLERADDIFADLDKAFRTRANDIAVGLPSTLSGMVDEAGGSPDRQSKRAAAVQPVTTTGGGADIQSMDSAIEATRTLSRLLAPASPGRSEHDRGAALAAFGIATGCHATPPCTDEFIQAFEVLIGRALTHSGGDDLAATLLKSDLGGLYQHLARQTGRLPS